MLVLARKKGQSIVIGDNIEVSIIDIQGDQVRLGINAPKNISIHRKEIFLEIMEENKKAANTNVETLKGFLGKDI
jgi:carbon storage regulator